MKNINEFNEETKTIIKQFIEDLFFVLPNLENKISKTEIEKSILKNLEHNIEFNCELEKGINGQYNSVKKKISISKKLSDNNQQLKLTLFHELIHVVTADVYKDEFIKNNSYIIEVFTTLLEEKYNREIIKKETTHNRVNGYIPDFGRQMHLVYGDLLLEQFITDPENMYIVFRGFSDQIKKFLYKKFTKEFQLLDYQLKNMDDDANIKSVVYELEKTIAGQLLYKINTQNIDENLEIIEDLFTSQYYPEFLVFSSLISRIQDETKLNNYPVLKKLKFICETTNIDKMIEELNKISIKDSYVSQIRCIAMQKIFGYAYDGNVDNMPDIFDFLQNIDVYQDVLNCLLEKSISVNEISDLNFRRCSDSGSKIRNRLTFDFFNELVSYNSSRVLFALFDSNDSMTSVFNQYELENTKHGILDVVNVIKDRNVSLKIISYLKTISEEKGITEFYWENIIQDLEEDPEYWDFQIFYRSSDDELSQILVSFDKNKNLIFGHSTVQMAKKNRLIPVGGSIDITNTFKKN